MADNILVSPGTGATIAADDIGGVLHQRIKVTHGADGSATDVSTASPMPVTGASGTFPVTGTFYQAIQPVSAAALPLPTGAATESTLGTRLTESDFDTKTGALTETAPATDTASSGLNGRLQRIAQRITSLIALLPAALGAGGGLKVDGSGTALPVSGTFWQATQPISGTVTANAGTGTMAVSMATNTPLGTVAHDSADSGAPIKTGGRAVSAEITPVTTGDRTDSIHDLAGRQIVMPYSNPENDLAGLITTAMTGTTSTAVTGMGAQGGSLRNYITTVVISNSHATVGTDVILQDGNGGATLGTFPAAALYGGVALTLPKPIKTSANTALYAANVTTGASTKVSCYGYKGY